jgi:hypothetical protein
MQLWFGVMDPWDNSGRARGQWVVAALLGLLGVLSAGPAAAAGEEVAASVGEAKGSAPAESDVAPATPPLGPSLGPHLMFLEGGIRQDLGTFSRRETVGDNVQTAQDEIDTFHSMFHVGFLERVADRVRFGGAFGYGGNYNYSGNNLLGQLLTFDIRVEYGIPLAPKWGLIGAPRFGLSMLIPAGQLADRINENQLAGYDTWSGPRYGFLVGADIGARYGFTSWLSARATFGYAWYIMLLLNSHASDGEISASQSWTAQASRLSGNLGLEVTF